MNNKPQRPVDDRRNTIASWKKTATAAVVAGLTTLPEFHPNGVRLDWLQREVLAHASGKRKPRASEIQSALNDGSIGGGVLTSEDPAEDVFCELVVTRRGGFRIFCGQWESSAAYTQTLIEAFEGLPESAQREQALDACYALLRVSEEIAGRSDVGAWEPGSGTPKENIILPYDAAVQRLAARTEFSETQLRKLGTAKSDLAPFELPADLHDRLMDEEVGDMPLEFHPISFTHGGIVVLSPPNISIALRAFLIGTALSYGLEKPYQRLIMEAQERFAEQTGFWPLKIVGLSPPNRHGMRASVCQYDEGRFLHVVQVFGNFDGFPEKAFASMHRLSEEESRFLAQDIERFWEFGRKQPDCRHMCTVVLLGGWGAAQVVSPPIDEAKVPANWDYLTMTFADCAVFGVCDDSKLSDILRIEQQVRRLERAGFSFMNINGILNLFGFWKETDGNLIPEHMTDFAPPAMIAMPTDSLRKPRVGAAERRGLRAIPHPLEGLKVVQRMEWGEGKTLRPVFASFDDLGAGTLTGLVSVRGRNWWIHSVAAPDSNREWLYQLWRAVLHWVEAVAEGLIARLPASFPEGGATVRLDLPAGTDFGRIDPREFGDGDVSTSLHMLETAPEPSISITRDWMRHLGSRENVAELELAVSILHLISLAGNQSRSVSELRPLVAEIIGSSDWRWLHAREAVTVQDRLSGGGLPESFSPVPFSAHSLVKCGSIWTFHPRSMGTEIVGVTQCEDFLARYRDNLLGDLISRLRVFNRSELALMAARAYQSARVEQTRWRSTIRALRAISDDADTNALDRQNEINGLQRAAKIIAEIAACEAQVSGGLKPGDADFDELCASALLVFGNGQLLSSIKAGVIEPKLRISPAGDLLSDREATTRILRPGVEWMNRKLLDDAAKRYALREEYGERSPWDDDLRAVTLAEWGVPAEAFIELQFVVCRLAEDRRQGSLVLKRSELIDLVARDETFPGVDPAPLIERLTLPSRAGWNQMPSGVTPNGIDFCKFDRPLSSINRPLLALDESDDPLLVVEPMLVADATLYSLMGLMEGTLNNNYWRSAEARRHAGQQGEKAGREFEQELSGMFESLGLDVRPRCKLSDALNMKVPDDIGDVDALVVSKDRRRVWVIEAKNLRLCRTETEAAARLSEYRGRMVKDRHGKERPDKMLRHLRRVRFIRDHRERLVQRLRLDAPPDVHGLLVVEAPQPMNFHPLESVEDARSIPLDNIGTFAF